MAIGGKDTTWKHATHGSPSSNTDYTSKTMSVEPSFKSDFEDATVFGDAYREKEATFKDATIKVKYKSDDTIDAVVFDLWSNGTSVTFELSPRGTTAGMPKYTGSMICVGYEEPFNVGSLQDLSVDFEVTGAVTRGTHP